MVIVVVQHFLFDSVMWVFMKIGDHFATLGLFVALWRYCSIMCLDSEIADSNLDKKLWLVLKQKEQALFQTRYTNLVTKLRPYMGSAISYQNYLSTKKVVNKNINSMV